MMAMKQLTKIGLVSLGFVLTFGAGAYAATAPKLFVNSNLVKTGAQPKLIDGSVYVPIRTISEELGIPISWDNKTKTVYVNSNPNFTQEGESLRYTTYRNAIYGFIMAYDDRKREDAMEFVADDFETDIYLEFPAGTYNLGTIVDIKMVEPVDGKYTVQIVQRVSSEDNYKVKVEKWGVTFDKDYKIKSIKVIPNTTKYYDRYSLYPSATWGI